MIAAALLFFVLLLAFWVGLAVAAYHAVKAFDRWFDELTGRWL